MSCLDLPSSVAHASTSRTVFVKLFGTMVTVSASLISGPEGPMILIGSSVASAFTRGLKVVSCFRGKFVIGTNLMSRSRCSAAVQ